MFSVGLCCLAFRRGVGVCGGFGVRLWWLECFGWVGGYVGGFGCYRDCCDGCLADWDCRGDG